MSKTRPETRDPGLQTRNPHHAAATGQLFVVATPIGNLEDLSPRARRVLEEVDLIACEDTRHSAKLLSHFGIGTPTISYHEHNEEARTEQLLQRLTAGDRVALISDAGTPLVSDPGYRLVRACRRHSIKVTAIPGPSALLAALSVAGLASDRFYFVGFLPAKEAAVRRRLQELKGLDATLVLYLSPHRLARSLQSVRETLGNREAFLGRELTKMHECCFHGTLDDVMEEVAGEKPRGEYTLVLAGSDQGSASPVIDPGAYAHGLMELRGMERREALRRAARELNLPRRQVYDSLRAPASKPGDSQK